MSDIVDNRREKLVDTISRILESAESDRATPVRARKSFLAALEEGIVPAGEEIESILIESDPDEETQVVDARRGLWKVRRRGLLLDLLKRLRQSAHQRRGAPSEPATKTRDQRRRVATRDGKTVLPLQDVRDVDSSRGYSYRGRDTPRYL